MNKHARTAAIVIGFELLICTACRCGEITSWTLVDAQSNQDIGPLKDGDSVDRAKVEGTVSVRADVSRDVRSVRFDVDGRTSRTESTAPFSVAGDTEGNYNAWRITPGTHTLKATPFSQAGAKGEPGKTLEITFTVKGSLGGNPARPREPIRLEPIAPVQTVEPGSVDVRGEMKKWHKVTLAFGGPASSETNANEIPFWEMQSDNSKTTVDDDYCFYKPGEVYVVYLKQGGTTQLDLSDVGGEFSVRWYDPRGGRELKTGAVSQVPGQGKRDLGRPPNAPAEDWVVLVRKNTPSR
jgi:hypothetical protein